MKKIIALLLAAVLCFSLFSCTDYKPVESTKEESETVLTITYDSKKYEVPFELYRTFFLNYKSQVDGGDSSVWRGTDKQKYIDEIDKIVYSHICEIYSVFHLCEKNGIDVFSSVVDDTIENYIKVSVEGGSIDGMYVSGFGGDYDAYLAHLKKLNMNYSVQEILFRFSIASELLDTYYLDKSADGHLGYTLQDIEDFYYTGESVRVIQVFFSTDTHTEERVNAIKSHIDELGTNESAVCDYLIGQTISGEDLRDGTVIGKYNLSPTYYSELTEAAFSLDLYHASEPIKVLTGQFDGYYILYRTNKTDSHFNKYRDEIEEIYTQNVLGKDLATAKAGLQKNVTKTDSFAKRDYSTIKMA